jgi:hypothetical protein
MNPLWRNPRRLDCRWLAVHIGYQVTGQKEETMAKSVADAVEAELADLSRQLTEPAERECLRCFLLRMISEFGCDGTHRWTVRWRNARAPRARGLVVRLQRRGGCCCDCEVLINVFPDYPATAELLPCAGVLRAGSAAPCDLRSLRRSA